MDSHSTEVDAYTGDDPEKYFVSKSSPLEETSIVFRESSFPTYLACFLVVELTRNEDSREKTWTPLLDFEWQKSPLDYFGVADQFAKIQCAKDNAKTSSYHVSVDYSIHQQRSPGQTVGLTRQHDTITRQLDDPNLSARSQGYSYIMHSTNTLRNMSRWAEAWDEQFPRSIAEALHEVDHAVYIIEIMFRYQIYTEHVPSCCKGGTECFKNVIKTLKSQSVPTPQRKTSFIPTKFFDIYFTKPVVNHILSHSRDDTLGWELSRLDADTTTKFIDHICDFGTRLLATCLYAGIGLGRLYELYKAGVGDVNLPLVEFELPLLPDDGQCAIPKWPRDDRRSFYTDQLQFCAHQFHGKSDEDKFVRIQDDVTMPFLEKRSLPRRYQGSYAHVSFVRIHEQHHEFSNDPSQFFAVKSFEKKKGKDFTKELAICRELASLPHHHLTPYLSAWEDGQTFNILFPKAECDLHAYLKRTSSPRNISQRLLWFLNQLAGLSEALASIHHLGNPVQSHAGTYGRSATASSGQRILCHHDLKPSNVLVFRDRQGLEIMKISDFGLAKVKEKTSRDSASPRTRARIGTREYMAPEKTLTRNSSRLSDVWSLGCIFLVMLLWFFEDTQKLKDFRAERVQQPTKEEDSGGFQDSTCSEFWHLPRPVTPAQDENQTAPEQNVLRRVVLKRAVEAKFAWLKSKAENSKKSVLVELVQLIRLDMLRPNPAARQCAAAVGSQLRNFSWRAQCDMNDPRNRLAELLLADASTVEASTDIGEMPDDHPTAQGSQVLDVKCGESMPATSRLPYAEVLSSSDESSSEE